MTLLPDHLLSGYQDFLSGRYADEEERYKRLAREGQTPDTLVIGCCDSRVAPEIIFNAAPGELFVVRNVANIVPPYRPDDEYHGTSAALEFAVMGLRVKHIVVMGHARCGGIRAAAGTDNAPLSPGDFIGKWITLIEPAIKGLGEPPQADDLGYLGRLERESVKQGLANLRSFPCVNTLEKKGRLSLHGAFFGISSGVLEALDETTGTFKPLSDTGRKPFGCIPA